MTPAMTAGLPEGQQGVCDDFRSVLGPCWAGRAGLGEASLCFIYLWAPDPLGGGGHTHCFCCWGSRSSPGLQLGRL